MFNLKIWTMLFWHEPWRQFIDMLGICGSRIYFLESSPFGWFSTYAWHPSLDYFKGLTSMRWDILNNIITWVQNTKYHKPSITRHLCSKGSRQRKGAPSYQDSPSTELMPRWFQCCTRTEIILINTSNPLMAREESAKASDISKQARRHSQCPYGIQPKCWQVN